MKTRKMDAIKKEIRMEMKEGKMTKGYKMEAEKEIKKRERRGRR